MPESDIYGSLIKKLQESCEMAIYERELHLLDNANSVHEITVIPKKGNGSLWFEIVVHLKDKQNENGLLVVTSRNTPRTWKNLDTLYKFLGDVCPNTEHVKLFIKTEGIKTK